MRARLFHGITFPLSSAPDGVNSRAPLPTVSLHSPELRQSKANLIPSSCHPRALRSGRSLSVEKADINGASENVAFHRAPDLIARSALRKIQLLIERRQLKRVMVGIRRARARSLIGRLPGYVRALQSAACQRSIRRDAFLKLHRVGRNIEDDPVRDIGCRLRDVRIGVVQDEDESHGAFRGIHPAQGGRHTC